MGHIRRAGAHALAKAECQEDRKEAESPHRPLDVRGAFEVPAGGIEIQNVSPAQGSLCLPAKPEAEQIDGVGRPARSGAGGEPADASRTLPISAQR
jgi:hypothetical protein